VTRFVLRAVTPLACGLSCALALALALAACGGGGGSDSTAKDLLEQTFAKTASDLKSGRLVVDAKLEPEGVLALGGPITLKVSGQFSGVQTARLPRFDLDAEARIAGRRLPAGAISDGKRAFLELDGDHYAVDRRILGKLRSRTGAAGIASLGIDPRRWITDAREQGSERLGGIDTVRIAGAVDVPALLADLQTGAGGAGGGPSAPKQRSAQQRKRIAEAVKSARVQLWSGKQDKILRQLLVRLEFDFPPGSEPPITGLDEGKIELRARIDDVNAARVKPSAPARSRPLSKLRDSGVAGLVRCLAEAIGEGKSVAPCAADLL